MRPSITPHSSFPDLDHGLFQGRDSIHRHSRVGESSVDLVGTPGALVETTSKDAGQSFLVQS